MSAADAAPGPAKGNASRWRAALPTGLYTRSLLIIITPVILLQIVLAIVFMERHYGVVTHQLSTTLAQQVAAVADLHALGPVRIDDATIERIARERLRLNVRFLPPAPLEAGASAAFAFPWTDDTLSEGLRSELGLPFTIEPDDDGAFTIRIALADATLEVLARNSRAYASNWHIFIVWMLGTAIVLTVIAVLFLRNQIRPIIRLADAAEAFGKGRAVADFRPRGAREVRRAAVAFLKMRARIERQIEQRTTMLAGVSHDLRTVLTRFRLQLAFLEGAPGAEELTRDVDEMTRMLEAYISFARGDGGEQPETTDIAAVLGDLQREVERTGGACTVTFSGAPAVLVRPDAFKRCVTNLVMNAVRFGGTVTVAGRRDDEQLTVFIDDDGPGIRPEDREIVFRPFLRLDMARNQDHAGTGLGLAIARDIARGHGGDILLSESPLGGLRATVAIPV